jgi:hypothetical protein
MSVFGAVPAAQAYGWAQRRPSCMAGRLPRCMRQAAACAASLRPLASMHAARRSTERAQAHAAHDRSRTPAAQSADDTSAALCAAASAALGVDLGPDSFQGSALARYQRSWSASTPAEVLTKRLRWLADKLGERAAQRILLNSPRLLLYPEALLGNKVRVRRSWPRRVHAAGKHGAYVLDGAHAFMPSAHAPSPCSPCSLVG